MKDIPVFLAEYGVASLVLREIPYRAEAYITIHDVQPNALDKLLEECIHFCRMAGAEKIYAKGHPNLESFSLHAIVYEMRGRIPVDPQQVDCLFPVTEKTVQHWREICNGRMRDVDCAATQTAADEKEILRSSGAYFIHQNGELLGIGWMREATILLVCSVKPGCGVRIMHTLLSSADQESFCLEVASTNKRAIRLYEKMGFMITGEKGRWYRVN